MKIDLSADESKRIVKISFGKSEIKKKTTKERKITCLQYNGVMIEILIKNFNCKLSHS